MTLSAKRAKKTKSPAVVKNCQLLRWRGAAPVADLRESGAISAGNRAFAGRGTLEEAVFPAVFSAVKIALSYVPSSWL